MMVKKLIEAPDCAVAEAVLELSAPQVAGPPHQGKRAALSFASDEAGTRVRMVKREV